jgi:hypothetical protein
MVAGEKRTERRERAPSTSTSTIRGGGSPLFNSSIVLVLVLDLAVTALIVMGFPDALQQAFSRAVNAVETLSKAIGD